MAGPSWDRRPRPPADSRCGAYGYHSGGRHRALFWRSNQPGGKSSLLPNPDESGTIANEGDAGRPVAASSRAPTQRRHTDEGAGGIRVLVGEH